jgi:hypothetical protein
VHPASAVERILPARFGGEERREARGAAGEQGFDLKGIDGREIERARPQVAVEQQVVAAADVDQLVCPDGRRVAHEVGAGLRRGRSGRCGRRLRR